MLVFANDGQQLVQVGLYAEPHAAEREILVAAIKELAQREGWCEDSPEDPEYAEYAEYAGEVWREAGVTGLLSGEDDVRTI